MTNGPQLFPRSIRPSNSAMTPREEYARAGEIRARAADRGESVSIDRAIRQVRREPLPRLRARFR